MRYVQISIKYLACDHTLSRTKHGIEFEEPGWVLRAVGKALNSFEIVIDFFSNDHNNH